jgi:hypothetical protein
VSRRDRRCLSDRAAQARCVSAPARRRSSPRPAATLRFAVLAAVLLLHPGCRRRASLRGRHGVEGAHGPAFTGSIASERARSISHPWTSMQRPRSRVHASRCAHTELREQHAPHRRGHGFAAGAGSRSCRGGDVLADLLRWPESSSQPAAGLAYPATARATAAEHVPQRGGASSLHPTLWPPSVCSG